MKTFYYYAIKLKSTFDINHPISNLKNMLGLGLKLYEVIIRSRKIRIERYILEKIYSFISIKGGIVLTHPYATPYQKKVQHSTRKSRTGYSRQNLKRLWLNQKFAVRFHNQILKI